MEADRVGQKRCFIRIQNVSEHRCCVEPQLNMKMIRVNFGKNLRPISTKELPLSSEKVF